jgi:hypothetical protein
MPRAVIFSSKDPDQMLKTPENKQTMIPMDVEKRSKEL